MERSQGVTKEPLVAQTTMLAPHRRRRKPKSILAFIQRKDAEGEKSQR